MKGVSFYRQLQLFTNLLPYILFKTDILFEERVVSSNSFHIGAILAGLTAVHKRPVSLRETSFQ